MSPFLKINMELFFFADNNKSLSVYWVLNTSSSDSIFKSI